MAGCDDFVIVVKVVKLLTCKMMKQTDSGFLFQLYRLEKYAECCRVYKDLLKNTQVCNSQNH